MPNGRFLLNIFALPMSWRSAPVQPHQTLPACVPLAAHACGYYQRLVAAAEQATGDAAPVLARDCAPALAALRAFYRGGQQPAPYASTRVQFAYGAAYVPHHAVQLHRALQLHAVDLQLALPRPGARSVLCMAGGPGADVLGLGYHLMHCAVPLAGVSLRANVVDHPERNWHFGRELVRNELAFHHRQHGLLPVHVQALRCDLVAASSLPAALRAAAADAGVVTVMNVLTEILAAGRDALPRFARLLADVFAALPSGAVIVLADMGACAGVYQAMQVTGRMLAAGGAVVGALLRDDFVSPFAHVGHAALAQHLFSPDPAHGRIPRRHIRSLSMVARRP